MKHEDEKRIQSVDDLADALRDVIDLAADLTAQERADAAAVIAEEFRMIAQDEMWAKD